ncbi:MAG: HAD family hydrolase [Candidatus Competibacteraceae bacterium]|jgi:phosphoglycolate phosphatase/pyrophosphatase PpaX|nr:HAD family hydrolase [Candidatus Competibacteraceae bacterium]
MIRCILFDVDGTLIDTWRLYIEAYIRTFEPQLGRRVTLPELINMRPTSEIRMLHRLLGAQAPETHQRFLHHYRSLHPNLFGGVYAGIEAMLATLRQQRIGLGIVTGKSRGAWEITQQAVDLGGFDVAVYDDDVQEEKPAPEGILLALKRLELTADEVVYIGDSSKDALAASAAGVRFGAALWPKGEEGTDFLHEVRQIGVWAELSEPEALINHLHTA